jgi:hypothetical protein
MTLVATAVRENSSRNSTHSSRLARLAFDLIFLSLKYEIINLLCRYKLSGRLLFLLLIRLFLVNLVNQRT